MPSETTKPERRLAAIFAADVEGYSRLMSEDEAGTLATLTAHREIMDGLIAQHRGRIANTAGDSVMAEFPSVVDAVECAALVQERLAEANARLPEGRQLRFRIGVHVGDVMVRGGDLLGDGVNVAARVQSLAEAGGVWLSEDAHRHWGGRTGHSFEDRGEQRLKNIPRAVKVYALAVVGRTRLMQATPPLPDKPSIAVLPFTNMSGDPDQEYFADGIVEDIITALSRCRDLFVIARNSSFTYKGRSVDVKMIGRELGVRYVVEGSVRKGGQRMRITAQLIDTSTGHHVWAEKFDGSSEDVFELQDAVAARIVGQLFVKVEAVEIERSRAARPASTAAYDHYLRGLSEAYKNNRQGAEQGLVEFKKAIQVDPSFAAAYAWAAVCYARLKQGRWMRNVTEEAQEGVALARKAVRLAGDDALALGGGGFCLAFLGGELETGASLIARALELNPHLARTWQASGWVNLYLGNYDAAVKDLTHAMKLSPVDPDGAQMRLAMALSHFLAGRYEDARQCIEPVVSEQPDFRTALRLFAAANIRCGRKDQAQDVVRHLLAIDPTNRVSDLTFPVRRAADLQAYADALREAGLPE